VALTMEEKRSITREMAKRHVKASKGERGRMLDPTDDIAAGRWHAVHVGSLRSPSRGAGTGLARRRRRQ
jgi:hypothetical protein